MAAAAQVGQETALITCPDPPIEHLDKHGYLFGHPIAHSMSPLFHQEIYDNLGLRWSQLPLPSTDIKHFMELIQHPNCFGEFSYFYLSFPYFIRLQESDGKKRKW